MPRFEVVVGTSTRGPDQAAQDAERKARRAGGEQIGIAADVCCGSPGSDPAVLKLLGNIATNIFKCQCKKQIIIGEKVRTILQGVPPPTPAPTAPSGAVWVVYILIKHR